MRRRGGRFPVIPETDPASEGGVVAELAFVRFKDPNEALGLAVRLLAGTDAGPFEHLPFGVSMRLMATLIDRGDYGFAQRGREAVGLAMWAFVDESVAERFHAGAGVIDAADLGKGSAGLVFAFRAVDREATRFLTGKLRDVVFADAASLRFVRDYGRDADRPSRAVHMRRGPSRAVSGEE